jgi:hypothetical protein
VEERRRKMREWRQIVWVAILTVVVIGVYFLGKESSRANKEPRPPTIKERIATIESQLDVKTTDSLARRMVGADNLLYNRILVLEKKVKNLESSPVVRVSPPEGE